MNNFNKSMDVLKVKQKLAQLVEFLQPYKQIVSLHIVDFYTKELWLNVVPSEIQNEVVDGNVINNIKNIFRQVLIEKKYDCSTTRYQNVACFLKQCNQLSLRNDDTCLTDLNELNDSLLSTDYLSWERLKLKEFMSVKKVHEVEIMSNLVSNLAQSCSVSHVVDIGHGKGYLTSVLAMHNKLKVLGIDSSEVTTCGSVKRLANITKHWTGAEDLIKNFYKQKTVYITENTQILELLKDAFDEKVTNVELVGLHTCGNLASTCLRTFVKDTNINTLINIGCCYHLIDEEFCDSPFWSEITETLTDTNYGFPMSGYLRKQHYQLSRNARMIAAHNIDRFSDSFQVSLTSIYYRCLLQILLLLHRGHDYKEGQVGRIGGKCSTFDEYLEKTEKKLGIKFKEEDVTRVVQQYKDKYYILEIYFLLRLALAPIVESIILLDRLLYLQEQDISNSHLVKLFDPVTSPRCFGIVSWKNIQV